MNVNGTVSDARSEKPLKGSLVSLSIGDTSLIENTPATDGRFYYNIPDAVLVRSGDILTCTAEKKGYKTQTVTYKVMEDDIDLAMELMPDPIDWARIFRIAGIILGIILLLAIITYGVYYFFFGPEPPPAVIRTFNAQPDLISPGEKTVITWDTINTRDVFLNDEKVGATGRRQVKPEKSSVFTLKIQGKKGDPLSQDREVIVLPPPRILRFSATPSEIQQFGSSVLEWQTENAECLYIKEGEEDEKATAEAVKEMNKTRDTAGSEPGAADSDNPEVAHKKQKRDLNGSAEVFPLDTTTYTLVAVNRLGVKAVAKLDIDVLKPPEIISYTASSQLLEPGDTAILKWRTTGAAQVFLNDSPTGHNFSTEVEPLETTTFTLKIRNKVGERQRTLTIRLPEPEPQKPEPKPKPKPPPPKINRFMIEEPDLGAGQSTIIRWVTEHAEKVYLNGKRVEPLGQLEVLPPKTTHYHLKAVNETEAISWVRTIRIIPETCTIFVYELENFRGAFMEFTTDAPELGELDNRVSSIKIVGNCGVRVYSAPNYKATRQEFVKSIPRLRGTWIGNNRISSLRFIKR